MKQSLIKAKLKYEGKTFTTKGYGDLVVLEYRGAFAVDVKFLNTGYVTTTRAESINDGSVRDYLVPSVFGVGILGTPYNTKGGLSREYTLWCRSLRRCYNEKSLDASPTYKGCTVSENFRYFPYFKDWCSKQIGFDSKDDKGKPYVLDKDILVKGNKIYSEATCCFVPNDVNVIMTNSKSSRGKYPVGVTYEPRNGKYQATLSLYGTNTSLGYYITIEDAFCVYKQAKEAYIKEVANKWKDRIDPRVYEALMNYQVEITD